VITAEELSGAAASSGNALDAVRRLRPNFLTVRGQTSLQNPNAGAVHVSIDGGPLQSLDGLSRLQTRDVAEIRYLNPTSATQRFGGEAGGGGVILVKGK
jgi:hypothetical protein